MRIRRISGLGCLLLGIGLIMLVSFGFRMIFGLLQSPIGWILLGVGLYYLWKRQPQLQQPMKYEVIEDDVIVDVPDNETDISNE